MNTASSWPMVALQELVLDTQYGTSAKSNEQGRGRPVLRMNNIAYDGSFDITDLKWVELPEGEEEKLGLRHGDLLFNRTNSRELVGKTGVWEGPNDFTFAGYLVRVRLREDRVLPSWVCRFMNSPAGKTALFHMAKPSINMANISASDLLRLRVPVAPIHHQRLTTSVLDRAAVIRRRRKEALALTGDLLRSTFLQMFGDPVTNPKGWPKKPLLAFGSITTGNTPPRARPDYYGDDIEWIKSDNINTPSHVLTRAEEGLSPSGRTVGRSAPSGSSLLTCIAGSPSCIGNVGLADREVAFNQQINAVTPNPHTDHRFLYTMLLVGKRVVQAASTNSMKGMVSKGKLEAVEFPAPPREHQRDFGLRFDCIMRLEQKLREAATDSERLYGSLVDRAFRGQIATSPLRGVVENSLALAEGAE